MYNELFHHKSYRKRVDIQQRRNRVSLFVRQQQQCHYTDSYFSLYCSVFLIISFFSRFLCFLSRFIISSRAILLVLSCFIFEVVPLSALLKLSSFSQASCCVFSLAFFAYIYTFKVFLQVICTNSFCIC